MAVNAFRPSESLFPTEMIRPMESLDDGGIIVNWFPTETIRPMESLDDGGIVINWFPTETIQPMETLDDGGIIIIGGFPTETIRVDGLAVDPNNPNSEVDGRDFLVWQRGNATPDSGPPAGETDGLTAGQLATLILPAVQDHGLLLPAVKTDDGLLLPAVRVDGGEAGIQDGTSNTFMFGEVVHSPTGRTDGVFTVILPSVPLGDAQPTVATETLTIAHEGFLLI